MLTTTIDQVRALRARNPYNPMTMTAAWFSLKGTWRTPNLPTGLGWLADLSEEPGDQVTHTMNGVQVTARVVLDEDAEPGQDDVTGTFTHEKSEHTIPNTRRGWNTDAPYYEESTYRQSMTIEGYRARGMSAATARLARARDVECDMEDDANLIHVGVEVALKVGGQTIGGGSLWSIGIYRGDGGAYLSETAADLVSEAISEALATSDDTIKSAAEHVVDLVNATATLRTLAAGL